jgi:polyhydroxybutyrate depolymerase
MVNPIDAPNLVTANDQTKDVALKMLEEVHHEVDLQGYSRKAENAVDQVMDVFYDPLVRDQKRLNGIATRLDSAAAKGDYEAIAAQQKIIDHELAKDQKHLDRKTTVDDVAGDVVAVAPMFSAAALVAGADLGIKHLMAKFDGTDQAKPTEPLSAINKPGDYQEQIKVNGQERTYKIHVPQSYNPDKPMPAVVMLHGISEDADSFAELTKMNTKADREGFITVYPEGNPILHNSTHLAWNVPNWDIFHPARHADDVQFVSDVIDRVTKELSIDPNRTYVAGFSNGGMLAQEVASHNSDKVAAVALVGTALSGKDKEPANAVSVIDIHGTSDPVVPYGNWDNSFKLVNMEPVSYTSAYWKKADGIESSGDKSVKGNLILQDSVNAKTGVEVKQIGVIGGTHTWPSPDASDTADQSLQATDEIWDFFSHHTLAHGALPASGPNRVMEA